MLAVRPEEEENVEKEGRGPTCSCVQISSASTPDFMRSWRPDQERRPHSSTQLGALFFCSIHRVVCFVTHDRVDQEDNANRSIRQNNLLMCVDCHVISPSFIIPVISH
jgi:hypothetical protein